MTTFIRRLLEVISVHPRVKIPEAEYVKFYSSRCWLATRHYVAILLDGYYKTLISPMVAEEERTQARGAILALSWLLEAEEQLSGRIAKNYEEVINGQPAEARLRELFMMIQEEKQNARRTDRGIQLQPRRGEHYAGDFGTVIQLADD